METEITNELKANKYAGLPVIEGKNPDRVHIAYINYPDDWKAQYNMLLMDGVTCKDCRRCNVCCTMFDSRETDTSCQWHPSRFSPK